MWSNLDKEVAHVVNKCITERLDKSTYGDRTVQANLLSCKSQQPGKYTTLPSTYSNRSVFTNTGNSLYFSTCHLCLHHFRASVCGRCHTICLPGHAISLCTPRPLPLTGFSFSLFLSGMWHLYSGARWSASVHGGRGKFEPVL